MIDEEHIRFVAAADVTDDCRVEVQLRKRRMSLTASQARHLSSELLRAAGEAESAASELVRPIVGCGIDMLGQLPPRIMSQVEEVAAEIGAELVTLDHLSPDCRADKHPTWHDDAWDAVADVEVPCECPCHTAAKGTAA